MTCFFLASRFTIVSLDVCVQMSLCTYLFVFLAIYKHYDGIIWPEILDDKAANDWWSRTKRWWKGSKPAPNEEDTSSHSGNIKSFNPQDHSEYRKDALNLYLDDFIKTFTGITESNDPILIIGTVYAIYTSMRCSYLYYDKNEHEWEFKEITEVCM